MLTVTSGFIFFHDMDINSNILVHTASSLPSGPPLQFPEKRILTSLAFRGARSPSQKNLQLAASPHTGMSPNNRAEEWWAVLSQCNRDSPSSSASAYLQTTELHIPAPAGPCESEGQHQDRCAEQTGKKHGLPREASLLLSSMGPP